ncbi:hypothetical protein BGZ83_003641 [Gryganskiella cystojenkinii]|nr:hypothetical protein BGZ83_003641 [Gryganskiella cystojenkinii]
MEPAVSALPLMIIVGLTAARDGFEDWKRHEVDQTVNTRKTLALHNWKNRTMEYKLEHHHHRRHRSKYSRYLYQDPSPRIGGVTRRSKRSWITERIFILGTYQKRLFRCLIRSIRNGLKAIIKTIRRVKLRLNDGSGSIQDMSYENDLSDPEEVSKPEVIGYTYRRKSAVDNSEVFSTSPTRPVVATDAGELYELTETPPENDFSFPYWRSRLWQDVQEGDMILLKKNDFIPADLLILSSSEPEPICYVETMNLDGETNLKIRQCVPGLGGEGGGRLCKPEECAQTKFWVDSEGPNNNLLKYHGAVVFPSEPGKGSRPRRVGIDVNHLLLRGCVLRNTEWVIGLALFTGSDTKLQMNAGRVPSKRSDMERKMNVQMMSIITFQNLVPVALYLTVEGVKTIQDLELYYEERDIPCMPRSWNLSDDLGQIEYIFSDKTGTLTTNQMEFKKCSIQGRIFDFTPASTTTTTTIMDQIKPESDKQTVLFEDLLAQSKQCCLDHRPDPEKIEILNENEPAFQFGFEEGVTSTDHRRRRRSSHNTLVDQASGPLGLGIDQTDTRKDFDVSSGENVNGDDDSNTSGQIRSRSSSNATEVLDDPGNRISIANQARFTLKRIVQHDSGEENYDSDDKDGKFHVPVSLHKAKNDFFLILSICHTVLVSTVATSDHQLSQQCVELSKELPVIRIPNESDYQAQSPDELALVIASKGLGYTFLGREADVILMAHPHETEPRRYQILNVLEFNSTRKRMSVIVKQLWPYSSSGAKVDGDTHERVQQEEILLLTKGADNIIFERVKPGQDEIVQDTTAHLQWFAGDGLRTLCLAYKPLDPKNYDQWSQRYHFASTFVDGGDGSTHAISSAETEKIQRDQRSVLGTDSTGNTKNLQYDGGEVAQSQCYTTADLRKSFKSSNRQDMLEELGEEMERNLILLGATGIEDRLQDGVPETIRLLKRAGIKIWMLTGDKMETAISIGVSTGLLSHDHDHGEEDGQPTVSRQQSSIFGTEGQDTDKTIGEIGPKREGRSSFLLSTDNDPNQANLEEGTNPCSDMELILVRGDYEPEKYPIYCGRVESNNGQHERRVDHNAGNEQAVPTEHPVLAQIRTALASFGVAKEDPTLTTTLAVVTEPTPIEIMDENIDSDMPSITEKSETTERGGNGDNSGEEGTGSSFGDYLPWRLYEKWESSITTPPSFTKPFFDSISSIKRRATTATMSESKKRRPIHRQSRNTALVIDGLALKFALEDPVCKELLLELACECTAVVCCRVSLLQKAMVVKMVKDSKKVMTLSIGDGANDVSMIQEAHIGIGVAGEEGLQAVMASDYSIGQFRFLARLLLVHGHYAYLRNTSMVMLFIFKNILGIGALFCYEFVCGFSSMPAFEYSYILLYNVVLTMFPPLIIGIFDRDLGPGALMTFPELYKVGVLQEEFTNSRFVIYSLEGVFQSILCFAIPYFSYRHGAVESSGHVQEMYEMGLAMAVASIAQANIFAAVVSLSFSAFHVIFIWGSVALVFVYSAMYTLLPKALSQANPNYGFTKSVMATPTFWAVVFLTIVSCNLPRLVARYIRRTYSPKDLDILQEVCQMKSVDHCIFSEGVSERQTSIAKSTQQSQQSHCTTSSIDVNPGLVKQSLSNGMSQDSGNVGAYHALSRYLRLDWTWGIVPASAQSLSTTVAARANTSTVPQINAAPTTQAGYPTETSDNQVTTPEATGIPRHRTSATLSPSLKKYPSLVRSRDDFGGLDSPSSGFSSGSSTNRSVSRHFQTNTTATEGENEMGSGVSDPMNPSMILRRQQLQQVRHRPQGEEIQSLKSASPTFVSQDPLSPTIGGSTSTSTTTGTQISVSDPLSSKPPTPILGFGFAQDEGMADLILGTRFYSQRHANRGSSVSIGQLSN